jgi:hypothetical protein
MNTGKNTSTKTTRANPSKRTASAPSLAARKSVAAAVPEVAVETELSTGAAFINSYTPRRNTLRFSTWDEIALVVRGAAAPLAHLERSTLQPVMTALTSLCDWTVKECLTLSVDAVLSHASIENFTAQAGKSASSYRAMLRRVAKANGVVTPSITSALPRRARTTAYTLDQIDALRVYATALTNDHRRTALLSIIFLSAGCGLIGDELRRAAPVDVHRHGDALVFRAGDRCVPVLELFVEDFTQFLAEFDAASTTPFLGSKMTKNITNRATVWVADVPGLPVFACSALRSFFALTHLTRGTGTIELLRMLNVKSAEALDAYIDQVEITPLICPTTKKRASKNKRGGRS